MARKKAQEPHVNHERWLVSYADFITLLFAFFVVMYAISEVDSKKMGQLYRSMVSAFRSGVFKTEKSGLLIIPDSIGTDVEAPPGSVEPVSTPENNEEFAAITEHLSKGLANEQALDRVDVFQDSRGLVIRLAEAGFFDSGSSEIKEESLKLLDVIVDSLKLAKGPIRVEGHTDNVPIHNERFNSNLELSTARATFVIYCMIGRHAIPPERLSASGYSEYHPIASNDTPEGRARNRRVDIVVLNPATRTGEEPQ